VSLIFLADRFRLLLFDYKKMEWTYTAYTIADYCITLGLALVTIAGVFATFFSSKKGQEFVFERLIGVNPTKTHENANNNRIDFSPKQTSDQVKNKSLFYVGILCCLLGGMTLCITAILMFQGCFLTSVRLLPDDDCPEYPVDCFIFGKSHLSPISNSLSFVCARSSKAEMNRNISDVTAWCYGWIIKQQTTKSILDQLGIAIALIGFYTTMLAVVVYLGKSKKTIVLSILYIIICAALIVVLLVLKWSFAPLTYAILSLGILLGIFGIVLYFAIPIQIDPNNNNNTNIESFQSTENPNHVAFCSNDSQLKLVDSKEQSSHYHHTKISPQS